MGSQVQSAVCSLHEYSVARNVEESTPDGTNIIGTRWIYAVKPEGRFKVELVVPRLLDKLRLKESNVSPLHAEERQWVLLSVAKEHPWEMHNMEVKVVYLQSGITRRDKEEGERSWFDDLKNPERRTTQRNATGRPYLWRLQSVLYSLSESGKL